MFSLFKQDSSKNIRRFTLYYALSGLNITMPIWVVFYLRVITLEQLAIGNSLAMLISIALQLPTGAFADLFGRKIMVTIGQIVRALAFALTPFAASFGYILILMSMAAIGESMGSGADSALLYDSLKEEGREDEFGVIYTKALTYYRVCLIVGSLIGGVAYATWYGAPYILRGIAYIFSAFVIYGMYEKERVVSKFDMSRYINKTKMGLLELNKSKFVQKLSIYYVAVGAITWSCLFYFNQPFAYDFGWTPTQMSYITAIAYLISSAAVLILTSHKNLLNRQRVYLGFPIVMIIALLPGLFVGKWVAIALMTLAQIAGSARYSILDNYANKEFESEHRATALSALNMLVSLGVVILIFAGGKVQGFADTRMVYTLLGVLSLIFIAPMALILVADHRQHKAQAIL